MVISHTSLPITHSSLPISHYPRMLFLDHAHRQRFGIFNRNAIAFLQLLQALHFVDHLDGDNIPFRSAYGKDARTVVDRLHGAGNLAYLHYRAARDVALRRELHGPPGGRRCRAAFRDRYGDGFDVAHIELRSRMDLVEVLSFRRDGDYGHVAARSADGYGAFVLVHIDNCDYGVGCID